MNRPIIEGQYETGKVKWANWNQGFGFIVPDKLGSDVHFRIDDGFEIHPGVDTPEFVNVQPRRMPRDGDSVVFFSAMNKRGTFAQMWGYTYFLDKAILEIANRSEVVQATEATPPKDSGPRFDLDEELAYMGSSRVAKFNAKYHQPVAA